MARDDAGGASAPPPRPRRRRPGDGPNDAPGGFIVESAPGTPGLIALVFPWEGRDAFDGLMRRIRHVAPIIGIVREKGSGRVHLSRAGRPGSTTQSRPRTASRSARCSPRGRGSRGRAARARWSRSARRRRWFRADGGPGDGKAFDAWQAGLRGFPFAPNRGTVVSAHQMGSARAGGDPGAYTADPAGRVRMADARAGADRVVRGLYVGDASAFPSALGVNPMITTINDDDDDDDDDDR